MNQPPSNNNSSNNSNNRRPHHNRRRRPNHNNSSNQGHRPNHQGQNQPRPQHHAGGNTAGGFNIERIYEKYLNLLDQHLIARRKYHDLFYRADPNQKVKLEKNFYSTLYDIRDFESKLAPDVRTLFEKRNNGLKLDHTYTTNHEIPIVGDPVAPDLEIVDPHYLQSQIAADYSNDTEESVGTAEDYLKYKNLF